MEAVGVNTTKSTYVSNRAIELRRLAELVCPLSTRSPPKGITDVGAEYPEAHAILIIGRLVLAVFEPGTSRLPKGVKLTSR